MPSSASYWDNGFVRQEKEALKQYRKEVEQIVADWKLA